ncbi:MAG: saccharopine dehydrogenase NADP-binding domain-containing protein [Sphingopyxis sp.]|nr:saccharopine dehydrogenase NADP-binding domain-containing protein [Sphingopyxis sp.]
MTKTILILGAGGIGGAAAQFAAESRHAGKLIIADRAIEAAQKVAERLEHAEAVAIDVTDAAALGALMARADAVINCVGPYYRFGPPVLAAALAAGIPYVDVCDDWEPTLDMLSHSPAAETKSLSMIIGMGASPGTANMIAAFVANSIDNPRTLITGWSLDDDPGNPDGAANEHWIHQATGTIRVWRDGAYVDERPLASIPVVMPGFEPRHALTIGHPEAVTLPRVFPNLQLCVNVMTLPGGLEVVLKRAAALVDQDGLALMDASRTAFSDYVPGAGPHLPVYPGVWAIADNGTDRASAYIPDYGRMSEINTITAAPAVAGLNLILDGKVKRSGVLAPEEAFDPSDYFTELAAIAAVTTPFLTFVRDRVPA